ncbi:hypothetical protein ACFL7E_00085 [Thermodesulfobacteriota bacterium]
MASNQVDTFLLALSGHFGIDYDLKWTEEFLRSVGNIIGTKSVNRIKGTLYTKDNFTKTETAFCGNLLSEEELSSFDLLDIAAKLSNRFGENQSNVNVKSGEVRPFMLVFFDLPENVENLDRYSVEIKESSPSSGIMENLNQFLDLLLPGWYLNK